MISCETTGVKWEDMLWRIEMFFPDIPEAILAQALRNSAIQFIRKSRIIKRWIEINTQNGVSDYPIELEDCYLPIQIKDVRLIKKLCSQPTIIIEEEECGCGEPVEPCICDEPCEVPEEIIYYASDQAFQYDKECNEKFWFEDGWINLDPAPDCSIDKMRIFLSITPSIKSCEIPVEVSEEYGGIIAGLARVAFLKMKDEEWYDPNEANIIERRALGVAANAVISSKNKDLKSRQVIRRNNYMRGRNATVCSNRWRY